MLPNHAIQLNTTLSYYGNKPNPLCHRDNKIQPNPCYHGNKPELILNPTTTATGQLPPAFYMYM